MKTPESLRVVEGLPPRRAYAREIVVLVLQRLDLAIEMVLSRQWRALVPAKLKSEQPGQSLEMWCACDCEDVNASLQWLQPPELRSLVKRPVNSA